MNKWNSTSNEPDEKHTLRHHLVPLHSS